MSVERVVFAPVERAAQALRPFRWYLFSLTLGLFVIVFFFALLGYLGRPRLFQTFVTPHFGAPLVFTFFAWGWAAFLLSAWFAPGRSRSTSTGTSPLARAGAAFGLLFRFWALFLLALFFFSPLFMWLLLWRART